jgi:hypothetical protein
MPALLERKLKIRGSDLTPEGTTSLRKVSDSKVMLIKVGLMFTCSAGSAGQGWY